MKSPLVACGLLALMAASLSGATLAGVLRVANDESTQKLHVYDGVNASSAHADSANMGVQVGSVTADNGGNRVFFIGNSAGIQSLYQLNYITTQQALPQLLSTDFRVTHLEWDASGPTRLIGVAIDPVDDSVELISLQGSTVTVLGMPEVECCVFRAGVSAFRSSDDSLFLVGRRSSDTQDQLFRFTMNPPALVQVVAIPIDLSVGELDLAAGSTLIGLAYSQAAEATRVFTSDAALNLTTLGSGMADCCFVLAGSTAFDVRLNTLHMLGAGIAGLQPNPSRQWAFELGSGAISEGVVAVDGVGLFPDATPIVDAGVLFEDGFE